MLHWTQSNIKLQEFLLSSFPIKLHNQQIESEDDSTCQPDAAAAPPPLPNFSEVQEDDREDADVDITTRNLTSDNGSSEILPEGVMQRPEPETSCTAGATSAYGGTNLVTVSVTVSSEFPSWETRKIDPRNPSTEAPPSPSSTTGTPSPPSQTPASRSARETGNVLHGLY